MENVKREELKIEGKNTQEKSPKIKHKEIAELREPLKNILAEMREHIDRGEYGLIIGDDASGRIPTWFFYNFLKELYKEKKLPPPKVRYFAGSRDLIPWETELERKSEEVGDHVARTALNKLKENTNDQRQRALVVTESILSGDSLRSITEALKKLGLSFDIVTIGLDDNRYKGKSIEQLERYLHAKIFFGQNKTPKIYTRYDLSGVIKDEKHVFAEPYNTFWERKADTAASDLGRPPLSVAEKKEIERTNQKRINEARKDAEILAHELVEWYTQNKK